MTWALVDSHQRPIAEYVNRRPGSTIQIGINVGRTATLQLSIDDPDAGKIDRRNTYIKATLRGRPIHIGRIILPNFTTEQTADQSPGVEIATRDGTLALENNTLKQGDFGLMPGNLIVSDEEIPNSGAAPEWAYYRDSYRVWAIGTHPVALGYRMWKLVESADASPDEKEAGIPGHGITKGSLEGLAILEEDERPQYPAGKIVLEALNELAELPAGPDYELHPVEASNGTLWRFDTHNRLGRIRTAVSLDYGLGAENVQAFTYQPSKEDICNRFIARGKANRRGYQPCYVAEHRDSIREFGVYEDTASFETKKIGRLRQRARSAVASRAMPAHFAEVTLRDEGDHPVRFGPGHDDDIWVGDTVTVRAQDGSLNVDMQSRIADAEITELQSGGIDVKLSMTDEALAAGVSGFEAFSWTSPSGDE
jgi:hypothetical protein